MNMTLRLDDPRQQARAYVPVALALPAVPTYPDGASRPASASGDEGRGSFKGEASRT